MLADGASAESLDKIAKDYQLGKRQADSEEKGLWGLCLVFKVESFVAFLNKLFSFEEFLGFFGLRSACSIDNFVSFMRHLVDVFQKSVDFRKIKQCPFTVPLKSTPTKPCAANLFFLYPAILFLSR